MHILPYLFFYNTFKKKEEKRRKKRKKKNFSEFFFTKSLLKFSKKFSMKPSGLLKLISTDIFLNLFQSLTCEKYFLRRCQNSQTDEQITKGPVGKQKEIGL